MLEHTRERRPLLEVVSTAYGLLDAAQRKHAEDFRLGAEMFCSQAAAWLSRFQKPVAIDNGLAIATKIKHNPRKYPRTTQPREFDTLFFVALFLMERSGMAVYFQWLKPTKRAKDRYMLRGKISDAAGERMYVARIILNAKPGYNAQFNEDHHSYRLRDLIQRSGGRGGLLPEGKLGRHDAIELCCERYATYSIDCHADLPPAEYRKLLSDILTTADIFHGEGAGQ